jgi:hypothetical protein
MRYDEFRDRWQAALHAAAVLSYQDRPQETIDVSTTGRRWRFHTLPRSVEPFSVSASISFRWDAFQSARSYTREEDLLTELLGRRARWSTQRRLVRVDIKRGRVRPAFGRRSGHVAPQRALAARQSTEGLMEPRGHLG